METIKMHQYLNVYVYTIYRRNNRDIRMDKEDKEKIIGGVKRSGKKIK